MCESALSVVTRMLKPRKKKKEKELGEDVVSIYPLPPPPPPSPPLFLTSFPLAMCNAWLVMTHNVTRYHRNLCPLTMDRGLPRKTRRGVSHPHTLSQVSPSLPPSSLSTPSTPPSYPAPFPYSPSSSTFLSNYLVCSPHFLTSVRS